MMRLDIEENRLAKLFPAFLVLDEAGWVVALGPSLARQMPGLVPGAKLTDHFAFVSTIDFSDLPELAQTGAPLELRSLDDRVHVSGSVLSLATGYLLAVRHLPPRFMLKANDLQMSDFGPDDSSVPGILLVGLQQAMIEEARQIALELGQERQRSAQVLNRFSRIAGYMAHDFNNLLSIIRLNANRIISSSDSNSQIKKLAGIIAQTAGRGSDVSISLMGLSYQRTDSRVDLEPDQLIKDNSEFFQMIVGAKVRIEYSLCAEGRMISARRTGLLNSLINLIVNARDAMPREGVLRISTALHPSRSNGAQDLISIEVCDTGHGMSSDVLANAFKPTFSSKPHGHGMGLASVLEFVTEMGGTVKLDSSPGVGTSCHILLPQVYPQTSSGDSPATEARLGANIAAGQPSRIILVEDEPFALEALTELLELQGYEVLPCSGTKEALAALAGEKFQLLLSDVVLPDGSGIDLAKHISKTAPDTRIILMSGYVSEPNALSSDWQFIHKPLDTDLLNEMISSALRPASRQAPRS